MIIVPLGIVAVVKLIPPEIMAEHRVADAIAAERPMSRIAAAVIVFIWVASIALVGWLGYHYWQKLKLKTQTSASADALCFRDRLASRTFMSVSTAMKSSSPSRELT